MLAVRRLLVVVIVTCLGAWGQEEHTGKRKGTPGRLAGTVKMINQDRDTIVVVKGGSNRQITYSADTKWMYGTQASNKPSSLDDLKEGWYINCRGTFDGVKLNASACTFREGK